MLINEKENLRRLYLSIRKGVDRSSKADFDKKIFACAINSDIFRKSKSILVFSSFGSETDTSDLIKYSLLQNKTVGIPVWNNGIMSFHKIRDIDEIKIKNGFALMPDVKSAEKITEFDNCLCFVPALSFDLYGNRLGFGGGYYDRFLAEHRDIIKIGLCYERCLCLSKLPVEKFDIPVDMIITESKKFNVRSDNE